MNEQTIKCPNCGEEIPLTAALTHQIKESVHKEYEGEFKNREEALKAKAKKLESEKEAFEKEIEERLKEETEKLIKTAKKEAEESMQTQLKDMEAQISEKDEKIKQARDIELKLRKQAREIEAAKNELELEVQRQLDKEREKIKREAIEVFTEEHRLKDKDKDKKISDMEKLIAELKRKAEQGPIQAQGEVMELDLEAVLADRFPTDEIAPVPQGMRGADIVQRVYTKSGQHCGTIVWEAKRTKNWSNDWIPKLKKDQRALKAEVAVIVSQVMPEDVQTFGQKDGVWVTNLGLAGNLAEALRLNLLSLAQAKIAAVGKGEKMEILYNYLCGSEFRQKVEAIVEAFVELQKSLEKEKKALISIWSQREKQLEKVLFSTAGMYGDMQGIIGASLPEIKQLSLESEENEPK
ncbi:MAG: DUF2130 domain-containing protein, partial [Promethearchaeota archaeon]